MQSQLNSIAVTVFSLPYEGRIITIALATNTITTKNDSKKLIVFSYRYKSITTKI